MIYDWTTLPYRFMGSICFVFFLSACQPSLSLFVQLNCSASQSLSGAEGEVKVKKKFPCRMGLPLELKKHHDDHRPEGVRRPCGPRSKEPRWGGLGTRGKLYRRSMGLATFPTTTERLKRATRKSTMLRGSINKV